MSHERTVLEAVREALHSAPRVRSTGSRSNSPSPMAILPSKARSIISPARSWRSTPRHGSPVWTPSPIGCACSLRP
jgi:hypothetical protein